MLAISEGDFPLRLGSLGAVFEPLQRVREPAGVFQRGRQGRRGQMLIRQEGHL